MAAQSTPETLSLTDDWCLYQSAPSSAANPTQLDRSLVWQDAIVPGTVAETIFADDLNVHQPAIDTDDFDWWYETAFVVERDDDADTYLLKFEGLATDAEVWLNGEPILQSHNMFREYQVPASNLQYGQNTVSIAFRSAHAAHKTKRPRPRWKTNLVNNQQLRWMRTTLLGRIPGWTPKIRPVGPWRAITLEHNKSFRTLAASVTTNHNSTGSSLAVSLQLSDIGKALNITAASVSILGQQHPLQMSATDSGLDISGDISVLVDELWWPSTHGHPHLHEFEVGLQTESGTMVAHSGRVGFREITVDRSDGNVAFSINGQPIFLRGGCWSSNDIISLQGDDRALEKKLRYIRDAGANTVRVGGTMVYESERFYSLCDELGLMVWQDFMLANMDYPTDDPEFLEELSAELRQQIDRIGGHPATVVFCGNSEVEQQAAMFGMDEKTWINSFYYETIPALLAELGSTAAYFAASPCEGALPFHNSSGIAHYFGVGAYKRPLSDLAQAQVKFASECLAFSNVPEETALRKHFGSITPATHSPQWKAGVPRDASAGWDFEDIRDHYIRELYKVDPVELRYADVGRYLAISQIVTGEVMSEVFSHWRDHNDVCGGGLIWWLNDIVPGAGWGFLDSDGNPKPLFYWLRRCWASVSLSIVDKGLDGTEIRAINETTADRDGVIEVKVLQRATQCIASQSVDVKLAANSTMNVSVDGLLGRFMDTTYGYRFGPSKHDLVVATFDDQSGGNPLVATYFAESRDLGFLSHPEIDVQSEFTESGVVLTLHSKSFLHGVKLQSTTHQFDDNYFDLPPDTHWTVAAKSIKEPSKVFRGTLVALNLEHPLPIK